MHCSYAQYCRLNLHVRDTNTRLIRQAHKMLDPSYRSSVVWRPMRHAWLREAIKQHEKARALYYSAMRGDLGTHINDGES
jgi:hypothetical protein